MAETDFAALDEDLPRTLLRERQARERQAQEREAQEREAQERAAQAEAHARALADREALTLTAAPAAERLPPEPGRVIPVPASDGTVRRLEIPFGHLVLFFLKTVLAAIPALLLLMVILWGVGETAQRLFPWLVKVRILIHFPG